VPASMRAFVAAPKRRACRLLPAPVAATVTWSWPAPLVAVVTCTGGRGLQATGAGFGVAPLLALGTPVLGTIVVGVAVGRGGGGRGRRAARRRRGWASRRRRPLP